MCVWCTKKQLTMQLALTSLPEVLRSCRQGDRVKIKQYCRKKVNLQLFSR